MKIKLIGKKKIVSLTLPQRVYGSYWITNENNENLVNIEGIDNNWVMKSNDEIKIVQDNKAVETTPIEENHFYHFLDVATEEKYRVFVGATYDSKMLSLEFVEQSALSFTIGNSASNEGGRANYISYENPNIHYNQILIERDNAIYHLKNMNPDVNVYVNNYLVEDTYLKYGDVVFCEGLTFSFVGNILLLGTVETKVKYVTNKFSIHSNSKLDYSQIDKVVDQSIEMYQKNDYFVRPPRFSEIIEPYELEIDSPPNPPSDENTPMILTLGPMLIMGMSASVSGATALIKVIMGEATLKDNFTSILTAGCMIMAMLIFPTMNKMYQKRKAIKKENLRQEKYHEYIKQKENELRNECTRQKRILTENNVSLKDVGDIILYRKRNLWERKITHRDFLELRLGIGNVIPKIKVQFKKEQFELQEDNLEEEARQAINANSLLENVPVTISFKEKYISALIGKYSLLRRYMDGLILQMMAYHSYDELKIVILTNENNKPKWEKYKNIPYIWNTDKTMRYYAVGKDEIARISSELENLYQERASVEDDKELTFGTYYMIITDDVASATKAGIVRDILKDSRSRGFSLLFLTDTLNSLPSECSSFISIDATVGGIFENELVNKKQEFVPDFTETTIDSYIYMISNIPIETLSSSFELPSVYTFLEMYDAGNVEQLNAFNRWQKNDPTTSLSCPVGIDENGELFKLDLHEKVHGPHGLIAGMTGSGKSEFIITYILSMAVNYNPNEVQFVLIDYKGGGLAGAFENKETGDKLPHLAGTITNLDISEINRSLASLESELKRRQRVFNEARDACNESTIDIYKYQKLYREGKVKEPIAHLFIISDEFAELKSQQPEFMDELISAARIGRSLGVHLILATQKPSGVVDNQIWSNAKFRVCLKVQDKSDSNDMIRVPDAAYLKETGRFYLQVGFNEFFALGQSAWAGAAYYPVEKRKKLIDSSVAFVNDIGERVKSIDNDKQNLRGVHQGEEITSILKYLQNIGKAENIQVKQLWLDSIPAQIYIDDLKYKYHYEKKPYMLEVPIGEYDAPKEQRQGLLTIPLTTEGNLLIYGAVGSGKENLVSTIIFSLITTYSAAEVYIYVLDFGTEALKMYEKAPQVGGIVSSSEKDKIKTLIDMLKNEINLRKNAFANYNGNFIFYNQRAEKKIPNIVVIINGFESFNENYAEFADDLVLLTREGPKYGIMFITTVSATNNIRIKLSQNFNLKLALQMNDEFDYRQIIGKSDVSPAKIIGRGLAKVDDIYEFQTAYPTDPANINDHVEKLISVIAANSKTKAVPIPTIPEIVKWADVSSEFDGLNSIPIGIAKDNLNILSVDLKNQLSLIISANKIESTKDFVENYIMELCKCQNTAVYVIDAERLVTKAIPKAKIYTTAFAKVFESLKEIVDKLNDIYVNNDYNPDSLSNYGDMVFVITGMNKIKTILADNFDTLVGQTIQTSKKLSKICYVLVDTFDNLKKLEYDIWYKDIINSTRGIWIGNGLAEQSVFRLNVNSRAISDNIPNNFGYNIVSGIPTLFKYVEDASDDTDVL